MKIISGGAELKDKWQHTVSAFTSDFDHDHPQFITLHEAFIQRFKEHNFRVDTVAQFTEETRALDEIIQRLRDLQRRNNALVKKYNGDTKFARVHKRIREENQRRTAEGKSPMFSLLDD